MAEQIFEFDGTLDKFIGDAILAVFGAPLPQEDHADRAIEAALAMRHALAEMNKDLAGEPLRMRIAINSGVALTGDIGSPRRREFTVLGDVVNACSRIESTVCKPGQIVCSRATLDRARKSLQHDVAWNGQPARPPVGDGSVRNQLTLAVDRQSETARSESLHVRAQSWSDSRLTEQIVSCARRRLTP